MAALPSVPSASTEKYALALLTPVRGFHPNKCPTSLVASGRLRHQTAAVLVSDWRLQKVLSKPTTAVSGSRVTLASGALSISLYRPRRRSHFRFIRQFRVPFRTAPLRGDVEEVPKRPEHIGEPILR